MREFIKKQRQTKGAEAAGPAGFAVMVAAEGDEPAIRVSFDASEVAAEEQKALRAQEAEADVKRRNREEEKAMDERRERLRKAAARPGARPLQGSSISPRPKKP